MSTASYTQRWRNVTNRWRTAAGPRFNPSHYGVSELDKNSAEEFCLRHHYSAAWPATKYPLSGCSTCTLRTNRSW